MGGSVSELLPGVSATPRHPISLVDRALGWQRVQIHGVRGFRRQCRVPPVTKLLEAKAKSPAALLLACDEILAAGPPVIAQGFALWQRAKALESLNRMAEALAAFDELHRHRLDHPAYVENARIGRARCLMALGKRDDAVVELTALAQDAFSKDVATWATKKSEELEGQRAKQH